MHIRDRIVQRSLNDNAIYPAMTKSFIWDNMACQTGKGTTKAMDRINRLLHRYYINNGNSNAGWVLQFDIKGYYRSMRHADAMRCFRQKLDRQTADNIEAWMAKQYPGSVGYAPGSQLVQILGISFLDSFDHYAKERLRARYYLRYMDDGVIISDNKEHLERCRCELAQKLAEIGLQFHEKKTRIYRISDGIRMLGFTFRLTKTGKIIRIIDPKNVKHERKKLYRFAQKVKRGQATKEKYWECYTSWRAHARKGNSYMLLRRMDAYAKELLQEAKEDAQNHDRTADETALRAEDGRNSQGTGGEGSGGTGLQHHDGDPGGSGRGGQQGMTEYSKKYRTVKNYYDSGEWKRKAVENAVKHGWITEEECAEILGADLVSEIGGDDGGNGA